MQLIRFRFGFFITFLLLFGAASNALSTDIADNDDKLEVRVNFDQADRDSKGLNFIDIIRVKATAKDEVTGKTFDTINFFYEGKTQDRLFKGPISVVLLKTGFIQALGLSDSISKGHPVSLTVQTQIQGAHYDLYFFVLTTGVLDSETTVSNKHILYTNAQKQTLKPTINLQLTGDTFELEGHIAPNLAGLKSIASGATFPSKLFVMISDGTNCRLYDEIASTTQSQLSTRDFTFARNLYPLARKINELKSDNKLGGTSYSFRVKSDGTEKCGDPVDFFTPLMADFQPAIADDRLSSVMYEVSEAKNTITLEQVDDNSFNIVVTTMGDGTADNAKIRFAGYASPDDHAANYRNSVLLSDLNLQSVTHVPQRFVVPISKAKLKYLAHSKGVTSRNARIIMELTSHSLSLEPGDGWERKKELDGYPRGFQDDYYHVVSTAPLDFAMEVSPTALDVDSIRVIKVDENSFQVIATTSGDGTADKAELFIAGYASPTAHPAEYSSYAYVGNFDLQMKKKKPQTFIRTITKTGLTNSLSKMTKLGAGNARIVLELTTKSLAAPNLAERKKLFDGEKVPGKYYKLKVTDTLDKLPTVTSVSAITDSIRVEKAAGGKYRVIATTKGDGTADYLRVLLIGLSDAGKKTKQPVNYEYVNVLETDPIVYRTEPRIITKEYFSNEIDDLLKKMKDKTAALLANGNYPLVTAKRENAMFALELTSSSGSSLTTLSDPIARGKLAKGEYVRGGYLVFRNTDYLDKVLTSAETPVRVDGGRGVLYYCLRPFDGQIIGQSSPCLANCLLGEMRVAAEVSAFAKKDFAKKTADDKRQLVTEFKAAQNKLPGDGVKTLLESALKKPGELKIDAKIEGSVAYSIGGLSSDKEFSKYLAKKFTDTTGFWTSASDPRKRLKKIEVQSCKCDANDYFIQKGGIGSTPIGKYCGVEKSGENYDVKSYSLEGTDFVEISHQKTAAASERDLAKLRSASKQITLFPVKLSSRNTRFEVSNSGGRPLAYLSEFGLRMTNTPYGVGRPGAFKPFERVFIAGKEASKDKCVSLSPKYASNEVHGTLVKNLESIDLKMNLADCSDLFGTASFVALPVVASPFYFLLPVEIETPVIAFVLKDVAEAKAFQNKVLAPDGKFNKGIFKDDRNPLEKLDGEGTYALLTPEVEKVLYDKAKKDKKEAKFNMVIRLPDGFGTKAGFAKWKAGKKFIADAIKSVTEFDESGKKFKIIYDDNNINVEKPVFELKDGDLASFGYLYRGSALFYPTLTLECPDAYIVEYNLTDDNPEDNPAYNLMPMSKRGGAGEFTCTVEDRKTGKKASFKVKTTT